MTKNLLACRLNPSSKSPVNLLRRVFLKCCLAVWLGAGLLSSPVRAQDANLEQLDVPALIRQSEVNGAAMHARLPEYAYTLKQIVRKTNKRGETTEEVKIFEAYPVAPRRRHVLIQVSENGAAVAPERVAKERRRAGENLARAEREAASEINADTASATVAKDYFRLSIKRSRPGGKRILVGISDFLRSCDFTFERRERRGEREIIVLSFRPRADALYTEEVKYLSRLAGTIWIDAEDKVATRLEAFPATGQQPGATGKNSLAKPASGSAVVIIEQARVPQGFWFPRSVRVNAVGLSAVFNTIDWDTSFELTDYKRFDAEVKDVLPANPQ